jgi:hypothetical protein
MLYVCRLDTQLNYWIEKKTIGLCLLAHIFKCEILSGPTHSFHFTLTHLLTVYKMSCDFPTLHLSLLTKNMVLGKISVFKSKVTPEQIWVPCAYVAVCVCAV